MNCFEFMGLPEDHRNHPVMLVKHRHEVPDSRVQFPVWGQVKRDGVFAMLIVMQDGRAGIFGRTGLAFTNTQKLADSIGSMVSSGVYFGELQTLCIASLEQLSGSVNPNRVEPVDGHQQQIVDLLYIDFFDMLTLDTFKTGIATTTYLNRHAALTRRVPDLEGLCHVLPITQINNDEEAQAFADAIIDDDGEGAVFKSDVDYCAGHKGWRQWKLIRGLSVDLVCIGYEEGKGKYEGKVANLCFKYKGKNISAMLGKGWTHADAERMFHDIKNGGEYQVIGDIFTVTALQESSKGKLRNVKCGERRHDKVTPDN